MSQFPCFPLGEANDKNAVWFTGKSWVAPLLKEPVKIFNVTFEKGCRNAWHVHHAKEGGGQILLVTDGEGWYQEWGKPARRLQPGDVVNILPEVKHWHGAAQNSDFAHLAIEVNGVENYTEWCEAVEVSEEELLQGKA